MADEHSNTKRSEERSYERLREAGVPKENARTIAREAADQTSRTADRKR